MIDLSKLEIWFVTGSQHLYGEETLQQVARDSQNIAKGIADEADLPVSIVYKPVLTSPDAIHRLCLEATAAECCIGIITWMHTFSPAKMWIAGLKALGKPFAHLHTQHNRDIPWSSIDMDFMNLHQSAHGGREFGFIGSRMRIDRKVIVGYWKDNDVLSDLDTWVRAACAWHDSQHGHIARFGDNMREVAVTEGDKVEAQIQLGYSVSGYGIGDLIEYMKTVSDATLEQLLQEYQDTYLLGSGLSIDGEGRDRLMDAARIEAGMRAFLEDGGFTGFTTTFENLHGLKQLPGLAVQRLMDSGYGFGGEGDWKTAALVRAIKVMATGLPGGTSFMEDYTYHLDAKGMKVLGAHMLEVCPSISTGAVSLEIHPLGIGGKDDPARLVFNVPEGPAVNASIMDMGNRFRMVVNEVDVVAPDQPLPMLPVARVVWVPRPNLKIAAASWILAGGAHHAGFSQAVGAGHLEDFAEIAGIEYLRIGKEATISDVKKELRWNEMYYHLARGL
ncbi:MAG: L-arabinose isomerase [Spirochaetales bacterium]|jgi:L-arabinose isomerase|nr:L-arabinose isomerase [Spirochaetales bacterium]